MRRPNGSGAIIKLSGKRRRPYAVRIFDGIELKPDGNGKQKYKYLGYFEKQGDRFNCGCLNAFLPRRSALPPPPVFPGMRHAPLPEKNCRPEGP